MNIYGCGNDPQVMVIVDVRPTGGRGDVGIPTDAYFAVEEIKDVSPGLSPSHFTGSSSRTCVLISY